MSRLPFVLLLVSLSVPSIGAQGQQPPTTPAQGGRGGRGAGGQVAMPSARGGFGAAGLVNRDNVRIELAIAETVGGNTTNKTVILITSTDTRGSVRSQMSSPAEGNIALDVDAEPRLTPDGRIWLGLTFNYTPPRASDAPSSPRSTDLQEQLTVVLLDGKPLLVSQSADPRGDRKVAVSVTATVLK